MTRRSDFPGVPPETALEEIMGLVWEVSEHKSTEVSCKAKLGVALRLLEGVVLHVSESRKKEHAA